MIFAFRVNDFSKFIGFMPFYKTKKGIIYMFVWHNELKLWQNIICNFGLARIIENDKNNN